MTTERKTPARAIEKHRRTKPDTNLNLRAEREKTAATRRHDDDEVARTRVRGKPAGK